MSMMHAFTTSLFVATIGCCLACRCGNAAEHHQDRSSDIRLLIAYDVARRPLAANHSGPLLTKPYESESGSWFLVLDSVGRATAWPDPNRPFDRFGLSIGTERLRSLYQQVQKAGMDRFNGPVSSHPKVIGILANTRPEANVRVLSSATRVAGATAESYFTIGLDERITDHQPAEEDQTRASIRRSLNILRPVYEEVVEKGEPKKVDYVRYRYRDRHPVIGRGDVVVADGVFTVWRWAAHGWQFRPYETPVHADVLAELLAQLAPAGLFDLDHLTEAPPNSKHDSFFVIEARSDGREIRTHTTPVIKEIMRRFRHKMKETCELVLRAIDIDTGRAIPGVSFAVECGPAEDWAVEIGKADAEGVLRLPVHPRPGYYYLIWQKPKEYQVVGYDDAYIDIVPGETVHYDFKLRKWRSREDFPPIVPVPPKHERRVPPPRPQEGNWNFVSTVEEMPGFEGQRVTFWFYPDRQRRIAPEMLDQAERIFLNGRRVAAAVRDELETFQRAVPEDRGELDKMRDILIKLNPPHEKTKAMHWRFWCRTPGGIRLSQDGYCINFKDLDAWNLLVPSYLQPPQ